VSTTSRDARRPSTTSLARLALVTAGVAFPLLAMSSCGRAAAPAGVARTDSAGVEIVTNAGPDHPLGWSLDSVLSLRSPSGQGGDTIGFLAATDVAVLGDRVIVLDASTPALFVYDTLGAMEGRYGRKGNGPGELMMPGNVMPAPGGGVDVLDIMNRRIEGFDTTMASSGSISLRNVRLWGGGLGFAGDVPVLPERRIDGDAVFLDLVALGPTDTTVIASLRQPPGKDVHFKSCGMSLGGGGGIPPLFSPRLVWTTEGGHGVLVSGGTTYDIDVYGTDGLSLRRRIRRDLPPVQATKELAVRSLGEGMKIGIPGGTRVCDPEEVVEQQGFAPVIPPVTDVKVAPGGDIWVERWVPKGDPSLLDVFDSAGVYLGTLTGAEMPVAFLGEDRVIVRRTDEMDVPFLTIYRVVR
jgi:hypothetical protein